jgi:hypothetical protein
MTRGLLLNRDQQDVYLASNSSCRVHRRRTLPDKDTLEGRLCKRASKGDEVILYPRERE